MPLRRQDIHAGPLHAPLDEALERLHQQRVVERILARDHTVWKPDPTEISNRLGWLDSPQGMAGEVETIQYFVDEVRSAGFTHALLLGMGGSSLAPEVFRSVFGVLSGHLDLRVLDSTDPAAVRRAFAASEVGSTLYVPATKSGGTVETLSFLKYAYRLATAARGREAGAQFVAITDPGSGLAELARQLGFRRTFLNDPNIGGRYAALSMFGLVPASLCGIDIGALLRHGQMAVDELTTHGTQAPSVLLGALMGVAALAGRDKLTLHASTALRPAGAWIEQLVAESTGKEGQGILPVDGEHLAGPEAYSQDRLFVCSQGTGDAPFDAKAIEALIGAGHPVARIDVATHLDLAAEMMRWEIATTIAGHLLAINPFDQPDVEAAKVQTRSMVEAYRATGALPTFCPVFTDAGIDVHTEVEGDCLAAVLATALQASPRPAYVSLQAYLPPTAATDAALSQVRRRLRRGTGLATTAGYGPRFLHSTGQLHKGDAGRGLFIQLTCDDDRDEPIPATPHSDASHMSFGVLKAAQALGDAEALRQGGRSVLRLHLRAGIEAGLASLLEAVETALAGSISITTDNTHTEG